jgi:hypothetical protein
VEARFLTTGLAAGDAKFTIVTRWIAKVEAGRRPLPGQVTRIFGGRPGRCPDVPAATTANGAGTANGTEVII